MLVGLHAIDWHGLGHAYGRADNVPHALRGLVSDDAETRERAREDLAGTLQHQGTVYDATFVVVPFVLELLADRSVPERIELFHLLYSGYYRDAIPAQTDDPQIRWEGLDTEGKAAEHRHIEERSAFDAVVSAGPDLLAVTQHGDQALAIEMLHFLAPFGRHDPRLAQLLHNYMLRERDMSTLAHMLEALGRMGHSDPVYIESCLVIMCADVPMAVQLVAATTIAHLLKEQTPEPVADLISAAAEQHAATLTVVSEGNRFPLVNLSEALFALGAPFVERTAPLLIRHLGISRSEWEAGRLVEILSLLLFPNHPGDRPAELGPPGSLRRTALIAAANSAVWTPGSLRWYSPPALSAAQRLLSLLFERSTDPGSKHALSEEQCVLIQAIVRCVETPSGSFAEGTLLTLLESYGLPSSLEGLRGLLDGTDLPAT